MVVRGKIIAIVACLALLMSLSAKAAPPAVESSWTDLSRALGNARMLRFKRAVACRHYSPEQATAIRQKQFQALVLGPKTQARSIMLQKLQLWPSDCDLEATLSALVPQMNLEWYDVETHHIIAMPGNQRSFLPGVLGINKQYAWLMEHLGLDSQKIYRTYLLDHALLDQWFSLQRLYAQAEGHMDRLLGLAALCEGDAMYSTLATVSETLDIHPDTLVRAANSMSSYEIFNRLAEHFPALNTVPQLFRSYAGIVICDGLKFVSTLKSRGGWGALNRAWREGSLTSQQIRHPLAYLNGLLDSAELQADAPEVIDNLSLCGSDSAGEFVLDCWARHHLGPRGGENLAGALRGDIWWAYSGKHRAETETMLVWATAWTNTYAANTFLKAAQTTGAQAQLDSKRNVVLAVWGATPEQAEQLLRLPIKVSATQCATANKENTRQR